MNTASLKKNEGLTKLCVFFDSVLHQLFGFLLRHAVFGGMQNRGATNLDRAADPAQVEEFRLTSEPRELGRDADVLLARGFRNLDAAELGPVDRNVSEDFVNVL